MRTASTKILPTSSLTSHDGADHLTLTVHKNPAATGIIYQVETSADLSHWNHGPGHTVTVSETAGTLIVRDAIPVPQAPRRFIRLKVIMP